MDSGLLVIPGAAVAPISGMVTELVRDRLDRAKGLFEQGYEFQRKNLLELQDEAVVFVDAATLAHFEWRRIYEEATANQLQADSAPMIELLRKNRQQTRQADLRIEVLRARTNDEQVRREADGLQRVSRALIYRPPGSFVDGGGNAAYDELGKWRRPTADLTAGSVNYCVMVDFSWYVRRRGGMACRSGRCVTGGIDFVTITDDDIAGATERAVGRLRVARSQPHRITIMPSRVEDALARVDTTGWAEVGVVADLGHTHDWRVRLNMETGEGQLRPWGARKRA